MVGEGFELELFVEEGSDGFEFDGVDSEFVSVDFAEADVFGFAFGLDEAGGDGASGLVDVEADFAVVDWFCEAFVFVSPDDEVEE